MATNVTCPPPTAHRPPPTKATSNGVFEGDNLIHFALPLVIVQICLVVVVTRCLAFLLKPLREPRVVAEIIVSSFYYILHLECIVVLLGYGFSSLKDRCFKYINRALCSLIFI